MGASKDECKHLAKLLPFTIWEDDFYQMDDGGWAITIVFSAATDADRIIIKDLEIDGWIATWSGCESRGERCTVFKR